MNANLAAFLTSGSGLAPAVVPFTVPSLPGVQLYCRQLRLVDASPVFLADIGKDSIGFALRLAALTICDADGNQLRTESQWREALTLNDHAALQEICDAVMPIIGLPGKKDDPVAMGNESAATESAD
jgi:hypothetical protein